LLAHISPVQRRLRAAQAGAPVILFLFFGTIAAMACMGIGFQAGRFDHAAAGFANTGRMGAAHTAQNHAKGNLVKGFHPFRGAVNIIHGTMLPAGDFVLAFMPEGTG
jgi:hypothetical protein